MQRCSSASSHMVGPCSCGVFHTGSSYSQPTSFSMLFSMPYDQGQPCPYATTNSNSSSSSSVDCTLSLGTPSTRLSDNHDKITTHHHERRPWSSNFCWDLLHSSSPAPHSHKAHRAGNGNGNGSAATPDPLLARRCANCDTTSTPLWRNGPRGPKSLCNACGIRFKKEERRANAAAAVGNGGGGGDGMESSHHHHHHHQHVMMNNGNSWMHQSHTQASHHKMPSCYSPAAAAIGNEFRFIDEVDDRDSPFLSWRLNVTDRPGLVHDFTR